MTQPKFVAKIESEEPTLRLAVLIDADNAQAAVIENLLAEVARYGEANVKRIYGDFTAPTSSAWKKVLQKHAIKPVQQFAYTTGKNATDSTLIIDAMDLMYTKKFDGFCLVTSDSDFTGLAVRIREEGLSVFGFGEKKTPEAFIKACQKFIYTEVLRPQSEPISDQSNVHHTETHVSATETANLKFPKKIIIDALEQSGDDSGWSNLGTFGSYLTKLMPEFDSRLYGFKKLSELVKSKSDIFETEEKNISGNKQLYVRAKSI
jgi:hypothetical protein